MLKAVVIASVLVLVSLFYFIPYITNRYTTNSIINHSRILLEQIKISRAKYSDATVNKNIELIDNSDCVDSGGETVDVVVDPHNINNQYSRDNGIRYNLYSEHSFENRKHRPLTEFEKNAIAYTIKNPKGIYAKRELLKDKWVLHAAVTDYISSQSCINCHNVRTDTTWNQGNIKIGDRAGVLDVTIPIDTELEANKRLRNYIVLFTGGVFTLVFLYLSYIMKRRETQLLDVASDLESEVNMLSGVMDEHVILSKSNLEGTITYATKAFSKISGYRIDELVGASHNIVRHPDMSRDLFAEMWSTIRSKNIWTGDIKNRAKDGSPYYIHATIFPILDDDGEITEYVAFRDDITERILSQQELEKEKKLSQIISDNQQSILFMSNETSDILSANNKFFEFFDFTDLDDFKSRYKCICDLFIERDGYLKRSTDEFHWAEDPVRNPNKIYKALMMGNNKKELIFSVLVKKIVYDGETFYISTFTDITELEHAREIAEQTVKEKSDFMASVSHEIRTPMNGMLGFTKLLSKTKLDEKQSEYLELTSLSMESLLKITNNILDFSKMEAGHVGLDIVEVNPFEDIKNTILLYRPKCTQRGISLLISIDRTISKCILVDKLKLIQILNNLISNATKFTQREGTISVKIDKIDSTEDTQRLLFEVADTGIGMTQESLDNIFEPFTQASREVSRKYGGSGLGLTISSSLCKIMGGKLKVESETGKGSRFYFEIDVNLCLSPTVPMVDTDYKSSYISIDTFAHGVKVLVAEDNEVNRILMEEMLSQYGVVPDFAFDGVQAVKKATLIDYNIILWI